MGINWITHRYTEVHRFQATIYDLLSPAFDLPIDARHFAQAVLPRIDAAYNLTHQLFDDGQDANDIVQEVCLRAPRLFDGFRGGNGRSRLLAIMRNTWFSECTRHKQAPAQPQDDDAVVGQANDDSAGYGVDPMTLLVRVDGMRHMHAALAQLPVSYHEVLMLRELEDLPYRDIAAMVGMSVDMVMSRLAYARQQFTRSLTEDNASPCTDATPIWASDDIGNSTKETRHELQRHPCAADCPH